MNPPPAFPPTVEAAIQRQVARFKPGDADEAIRLLLAYERADRNRSTPRQENAA